MGKASRGKKVSINKVLGKHGSHEKELKPSQELPKTVSIIKKFIPILILLLVSFTVYFNALSGNFIYDDKEQILANPWIRDIDNIPAIFSKSVWSFHPGQSVPLLQTPDAYCLYVNYHVFGPALGVSSG
jgi:hypothetical protein